MMTGAQNKDGGPLIPYHRQFAFVGTCVSKKIQLASVQVDQISKDIETKLVYFPLLQGIEMFCVCVCVRVHVCGGCKHVCVC